MAREISSICNFIFGSVWSGLLMDTVDIEVTVRTVKGIYTYRRDHMAKFTVFSPWSRTIMPFPSLSRKIQAFQDNNKLTSVWNKGHAAPCFPTQAQPEQRHTLGKTRIRWSNWRHRFNHIKTELYNMQDQETIDFRKIDVIKLTP